VGRDLRKLFSEHPMKYVFLFESVHRVMRAEKVLKGRGIAVDLIPVPREINSDCGVAVEVDIVFGEEAIRVFEENKLSIAECYIKNSLGSFEQRKRNS
jgi:hypothetical protein